MGRGLLSYCLSLICLLLCPLTVFAENDNNRFATYSYKPINSIPAIIEKENGQRIEGEIRYEEGRPTAGTVLLQGLKTAAFWAGVGAGVTGFFEGSAFSVKAFGALGGVFGFLRGITFKSIGFETHQRIYFVDKEGQRVSLEGTDFHDLRHFFEIKGSRPHVGVWSADSRAKYNAKPKQLILKDSGEKKSIFVELEPTNSSQTVSPPPKGSIQREPTASGKISIKAKSPMVSISKVMGSGDLSPDSEDEGYRFVMHDGLLRPILILGWNDKGGVDFVFQDDMHAARKQKQPIKVYSAEVEEIAVIGRSIIRTETIWSHNDKPPESSPRFEVKLEIPETNNPMSTQYLVHRYNELKEQPATQPSSSNPHPQHNCENGFRASGDGFSSG